MEEKRIKVLQLKNSIQHYSLPALNIVAKHCDLTVLYFDKDRTKKEVLEQCEFKTMYVPARKVWKFFVHKKSIHRISKGYDVVISLGTLQYLSYVSLAFRRRKYKLIQYGIGEPASYHRHYGEASKLYYAISHAIEKRSDALLFYSPQGIVLHEERGFTQTKMFVANNTTEVLKRDVVPAQKDSILFIGMLYPQKGLQVLLDAYKEAYKKNKDVVTLNIVGGGKPLPEVKQWVEDNQLSKVIHVLGPIYDNEKKADIFQHSLACISPKQAGLSVLESMGYGVPFITDANAITGGEAFNIDSGINGLRVEDLDVNKMKDIILDISANKNKYIEMGNKAYEYYWACCKPSDMAQGQLDAINFVMNK